MQTFKKGDTVRSLENDCDIDRGSVYTITKDSDHYVFFNDNSGCPRERLLRDYILVKPSVSTEIEVGDTVKYLGSEAVIGCIHGKQAYASKYCTGDHYSYDKLSGGTCDEHKTFMGFPLDQMKLISKGSNEVTTLVTDCSTTCSGKVLKNGFMSEYGEVEMYKEGQPLIDKIKTTMTNIKDFVKTSLLSKEEKLLRKHGFKQTECGEYTEAAKQFAIEALCKQQEAEMIRVATEMEEANKDSK